MQSFVILERKVHWVIDIPDQNKHFILMTKLCRKKNLVLLKNGCYASRLA
jgi:hypothetical protein